MSPRARKTIEKKINKWEGPQQTKKVRTAKEDINETKTQSTEREKRVADATLGKGLVPKTHKVIRLSTKKTI